MILEPDAILAGSVRYADEDRTDPVVLTLTHTWADSRLDDVKAQRDPVTTQLTPAVRPAPSHTTWLLAGHGLAAHQELGSVRLTYGLLLERDSTGTFTGFWYEERMVVPTSIWRVTGGVQGGHVDLRLNEVTDPGMPGVLAHVTGLIRPQL